MWNIIFFIDFSNFNFRKKRKDLEKKREKKRKKGTKSPICYEPNNSNIFYLFVPDREISNIIKIRSNISSNGKNQYY